MSLNSDSVIGLFFEVTPQPGHSEHYFSLVEKLKPELANYGGYCGLIDIARCLIVVVFYLINCGIANNQLKIGVKIRDTTWHKRLESKPTSKITGFEWEKT